MRRVLARSPRIWFTLGAIVLDAALVNAAFLVSWWLRYELELGREVLEQNYVPLGAFWRVQISLTVILLLAYALAGLYGRGQRASLLDAMSTILSTTSIGVMLTLAFIFIAEGYPYSRLLFIYSWALAFLFLTLARVARRLALAYLRRYGIGVRRALVVGSGPLGKLVMHIIATETGLGYLLLGFIDEDGVESVGRFRSLGRLEDLVWIVGKLRVDEVFIALPSTAHRLALQAVDQCQRENVAYRIVPDVYELRLGGVDVDVLRGLPVIGVRPVTIGGFNRWLKRAVDVALAGLLLALLAPLGAIIAAAIKLDSPGPVFHRQVRLGRKGRPFPAYKFRSMYVGAEEEFARVAVLNEADGPIFKMRRDPRVTRVGRWLRRASLDELPQLLNVLRGEMSLVGPRPPIPREVGQYEEWHRKRLSVAPGLTGLWQVSGRSELPFDEMVMLDIYYIESWSLGLDFKILLRTIPAVLSGRGAY